MHGISLSLLMRVKGTFKSWVFGIARNKALHSKRRFLRTQNLLNDIQLQKAEEYFSVKIIQLWRREQNALQECISNLSEDQRSLLLARYNEKRKVLD